VISGNARSGVFFGSGSRARIVANRIGISAGDHPSALPNGASGIYLGPVSDVEVDGNVIASNVEAGIAIDGGAVWNRILGNAIHDNGGLGIDHGLDSVTFNDGANRSKDLPRFPVILSAVWDATSGVTRIEGRAQGYAYGGIVEIFANATADETGFGEAERSLGRITLAESASEQPFTLVVAEDLRGKVVTATLSRRHDTVMHWTSEISQGVTVW
jgi:parallel beta-helix repeat protein